MNIEKNSMIENENEQSQQIEESVKKKSDLHGHALCKAMNFLKLEKIWGTSSISGS